MLRQERKWNHIKCSIKIAKGKKVVEDKYWNKEKGKQIENSNKYNIL